MFKPDRCLDWKVWQPLILEYYKTDDRKLRMFLLRTLVGIFLLLIVVTIKEFDDYLIEIWWVWEYVMWCLFEMFSRLVASALYAEIILVVSKFPKQKDLRSFVVIKIIQWLLCIANWNGLSYIFHCSARNSLWIIMRAMDNQISLAIHQCMKKLWWR